jgi:hypothetical protein
MSSTPSNQTAIVVTPETLKHQIITRLNTLVGRQGGQYYNYNEEGTPWPIATIEDVDVYGLETKGRDVYLMVVVNSDYWNNDGEFTPYNANDFYIEQLWDVYVACEDIYESRFTDYANAHE